MKRKPVRLAVAALIAALSVVGVSQASVPGEVSARTGGSWCC
jgi:hypothetical protein